MAEYLRFRGPRRQVLAHVRAVAQQISGRRPADPGVVDAILLPGAVALLSKIQQSFITLSRTGSDPVTGITWPPLSPATIAQRRTTAAERKSLGIGGPRTRGLLTPAEDKRWRGLFASKLAYFRSVGMGEGEAKARAAQIAWAALKASGAKTKLQVLGSRKVDILRDTGILLRSLTPGIEDPNQVREVEPGRITVGTNVPYAIAQHAGTSRIPSRPFWPRDGGLPPAWQEAVAGAVARSMLRVLVARMQ